MDDAVQQQSAPAGSGSSVRVEIDGAVATIRLDRPPMNALNAQMQDGLAAAAVKVSADPAVRAVVIYGGQKVFAAGADIKEMAEASYVRMAADTRRLQAVLHRDRQDPKAGCRRGHRVRAWRRDRACPLRGFPRRGRERETRPARDPARHHPRRGRNPAAAAPCRPGQGQGHRLHRAVRGGGRSAAVGLVDKVVPDDQVYQAARRHGGAGTRPGPPIALSAAKQAIDDGLEVDLDTGLEIERLHFAALFATEDQRTGMRSFLENGPGKATFAGR